MFNLHGGTTVSTATISSNALMAAVFFHETTHIVISSTLFFLVCLSLLISVAMLVRFFINLKKSQLVFCKQEHIPF